MKKIIASVIFFFICSLSSPVFAAKVESVDYLFGFFQAPLKERGHYDSIPMMIGYNYDALPFLERHDIHLSGKMNFVVEPYFSSVCNPQANFEFGVNFLLKYFPDISFIFKPYFKAGLGLVYMTQHTYEQSTQFNFSPQVGFGLSYPLDETIDIDLEYRLKHISNCSIRMPNGGIDGQAYLIGVNVKF